MSFELADVYTAEYDEAVKEYFPPFPHGLAGKYYEEGLQYFSTFDGFGDCEILSVEDKFELNIRGNRFEKSFLSSKFMYHISCSLAS